mgnify:CR=1 FL=1
MRQLKVQSHLHLLRSKIIYFCVHLLGFFAVPMLWHLVQVYTNGVLKVVTLMYVHFIDCLFPRCIITLDLVIVMLLI